MEFGLELHPDGYRFLQYDEANGAWRPSTRRMLGARTLPKGLRLDIKVDAQTLPEAKASDAMDDATKPAAPALLLLSSGETSNFQIAITANDAQVAGWLVSGDGVAPVRATKMAASGT